MSSKIEVKAVIFDMDGLMIDTESIAKKAFDAAMNAFNFSFDPDLFISLIGYDQRDSRKILKKHFGKNFPFSKICNKMREYEHVHIKENGIPLKKGIVELLMFLEESNIPKGVGTSSSFDMAVEKLEIAGLKRFFKDIVGGDQVKSGKPAPDIFQAIAAKLNISVKNCLVLEDSEAGIKAGAAAGMYPVMIPDLKQPSSRARELAFSILPNHFSVIELLKKLV